MPTYPQCKVCRFRHSTQDPHFRDTVPVKEAKPKGLQRDTSPEARKRAEKNKQRSYRKNDIPKDIRDFIAKRSGGKCERCGAPAEHIHHEAEKRGMGGRHGVALEAIHDPKGLLHLCNACHSSAHGIKVVQ